MTACNVLITDRQAWVAQDHALYRSDHLPSLDVQAKDCSIKAELMGEVPKLCVLPERRLIVAGAGTKFYYDALLEAVRDSGGDIDSLAGQAPGALRGLLRDYPAPVAELRIVMAGYSKWSGAVRGVMYDWQHDFEPQMIPSGGIVHSPELDPDAPGADDLDDMANEARRGRNVPAFFDAMFRNQQWQCANQRMRAGVMLSDYYTLASVDSADTKVIATRHCVDSAVA